MTEFLKALSLNDFGDAARSENSFGSNVFSNTNSFEKDKI